MKSEEGRNVRKLNESDFRGFDAVYWSWKQETWSSTYLGDRR